MDVLTATVSSWAGKPPRARGGGQSRGVGTSKPIDGEDDLAEWAAIDKAYPRSSHSRFPSTPGVSQAMPTDDLLDQFFAEPSGKRARAQ
jgi:hypothetical protein